MINIENIQIDKSTANVKSIKMQLFADNNACHLVIDVAVEVDGFGKSKQITLHGEDFNNFWAVYNSDKNLLELLSNKIGFDLDTDFEFKNIVIQES